MQPPTPPASIHLRLLAHRAEVTVHPDGQPRTGRRVALLAYLALKGDETGVTRDELCEILWEPRRQKDPQKLFRQLLYELGQILPDEAIETEGRLVRLDLSLVWCDVWAFREALAEGRLEEAVELWEGEFMADCAPASGFHDWAEGTARGLEQELKGALETLVSQKRERGDLEAAASYAERAWNLARFNADAAAEMLELLCMSGQRVRALSRAQEVERHLREVMEELPEELRGLIARIRNVGSSEPRDDGSDALLPQPVCVGRERELKGLRRALDRVEGGGEGTSVLVSGRSGLGKSRLLEELSYLVEIRDLRLIHTRCHEVERGVPYGQAVAMVDRLLEIPEVETATSSDLARLEPLASGVREKFPDLPDVADVPDTRMAGVHHSLLSVLSAVAEAVPVVVLVDDLQWCDPESQRVLERLARATSVLPLVLVCTTREDLGSVQPTGFSSATVYELKPLSEEEVRELVGSIALLPPSTQADELIAFLLGLSGGVPLYVVEALAALRGQGLIGIEDDAWVISEGLSAEALDLEEEAVQSVLRPRIKALSPGAKRVLGTMAILGHATDPECLRALLEMPGPEVWAAIRELTELGLCEQGAEARFQPTHDEIGRAARSLLDPAVRTSLHRRTLDELIGVHGLRPERGASLELLRHALAAGARTHAQYFALLLCDQWGDPTRGLDRAMESIERWASSPEFGREVNSDLDAAATSPGKRRKRLRRLSRELSQSAGVPWASPRLLAAGIIVTLLGAYGLWALTGATDAPSPPLGGGGTLVFSGQGQPARLFRVTGPALSDLEAVEANLSPDPLPWSSNPGGQLSPSLRRWAYKCSPPNADGPEVCVAPVADGESMIVAPHPGHDQTVLRPWSPDEKSILIVSDRAQGSRYNWEIFTVSLTDGSVTQISNDPFETSRAAWSPDGSRIVYAARRTEPPNVWIATQDGRELHEVGVPGYPQHLAWNASGTTVAISAENRDRTEGWLGTLDASTGELSRVRSEPLRQVAWTPDGQYLVGVPPTGRTSGPGTLTLFTLEGVVHDSVVVEPGLGFTNWVPPGGPRYVNRLEVTLDSPSVRVGEALPLVPSAWDQHGDAMVPPFYEFRALTEGSGSAISSDVFRAVEAGPVRIVGSAGGWRTDTSSVTVLEGLPPSVIFSESWEAPLDTSLWKPWGEPLPEVHLTEGDRSVLRNNGDSLYPSGVATRQSFAPSGAFTLEWSQKTPLTGQYWQEVWVDLLRIPLESIRPGPGDPYSARNGRKLVGVRSPLLEQQPPEARLVTGCAPSHKDLEQPYPERLQQGGWHHFAVQVHPTGVCDFLIDGKLYASLTPGEFQPMSFRIVVGGRSVGTEVLIDDLALWRGIRWAVRPDSTARLVEPGR